MQVPSMSLRAVVGLVALPVVTASGFVYSLGADQAPALTKPAPVLSLAETELALAEHLGFSQLYGLQQASSDAVHVLDAFRQGKQPLFRDAAEDSPSRLLIVAEGFENVDGLQQNLAFRIDGTPSATASSSLIDHFLNEEHHPSSARRTCRRGGAGSSDFIQGGLSTRTAQCPSNAFSSTHLREQLEVIEADIQAMVEQDQRYKATSDLSKGSIAAFYIRTAQGSAIAEGKGSSTLREDSADIQKFLARLKQQQSLKTVVVLLPSTDGSNDEIMDSYGAGRQKTLGRRQYTPEIPLTASKHPTTPSNPSRPGHKSPAATHTSRPSAAKPFCYYSLAACNDETARCSGHGACAKRYTEKTGDESATECWACVCQPTVLQPSTGRKTIHWGGPACQKKDISAPFFLLAGFTVVAIGAITYGIGMLYKMGEQELPSVLSAGVAPVRK